MRLPVQSEPTGGDQFSSNRCPPAARQLLRRRFLRWFAGCVSGWLLCVAGARADDTPLTFPRIPPTEPAKAAATFEVRDGFRMELIAAEPLVTSPVALEYDEDGRGWVLEMRD